MPFESKAQAKWMFANNPEMAREWASKTKSIKKLPVRKSRTFSGQYKPISTFTKKELELHRAKYLPEKYSRPVVIDDKYNPRAAIVMGTGKSNIYWPQTKARKGENYRRNISKFDTPAWEKPDPTKSEKHLSQKKENKARARARAAGRPYPNLVDNMAVSKAVRWTDSQGPDYAIRSATWKNGKPTDRGGIPIEFQRFLRPRKLGDPQMFVETKGRKYYMADYYPRALNDRSGFVVSAGNMPYFRSTRKFVGDIAREREQVRRYVLEGDATRPFLHNKNIPQLAARHKQWRRATTLKGAIAATAVGGIGYKAHQVKKFDTPAWTRSEGKNPNGGLNAKGRASAKAEGHNLKPPVKSGDNPRRKSFLARMGNMPGPEHKPNGEPTRLLLSLNAWGASSKADARKKAASMGVSKAIPRYAIIREGGKRIRVQVTHQHATGQPYFGIIHPQRGQELAHRDNLTFLPGAKNPEVPRTTQEIKTPKTLGQFASRMLATSRKFKDTNPQLAATFERKANRAIQEGRDLKYPFGKPEVSKALLPLRSKPDPFSLKFKTNHAVKGSKQSMLPRNMNNTQGINVQKAYDSSMAQSRFGNSSAVGHAYEDIEKAKKPKKMNHHERLIRELAAAEEQAKQANNHGAMRDLEVRREIQETHNINRKAYRTGLKGGLLLGAAGGTAMLLGSQRANKKLSEIKKSSAQAARILEGAAEAVGRARPTVVGHGSGGLDAAGRQAMREHAEETIRSGGRRKRGSSITAQPGRPLSEMKPKRPKTRIATPGGQGGTYEVDRKAMVDEASEAFRRANSKGKELVLRPKAGEVVDTRPPAPKVVERKPSTDLVRVEQPKVHAIPAQHRVTVVAQPSSNNLPALASSSSKPVAAPKAKKAKKTKESYNTSSNALAGAAALGIGGTAGYSTLNAASDRKKLSAVGKAYDEQGNYVPEKKNLSTPLIAGGALAAGVGGKTLGNVRHMPAQTKMNIKQTKGNLKSLESELGTAQQRANEAVARQAADKKSLNPLKRIRGGSNRNVLATQQKVDSLEAKRNRTAGYIKNQKVGLKNMKTMQRTTKWHGLAGLAAGGVAIGTGIKQREREMEQ